MVSPGFRASLIAQLVKNLPAMWETWVRSLGWEDPLEKGKVTHSSINGLENSMDCVSSMGSQSQTRLSDFHLHFHLYHFFLDSTYKGVSCNISSSVSNLLHSVWQSLGPSMLLQICLGRFLNFYFGSLVCHMCMCISTHINICLQMPGRH